MNYTFLYNIVDQMQCIGLKELPEDDFYCSGCKREDTTIKPGDKLLNKKLKNAPSQVKIN